MGRRDVPGKGMGRWHRLFLTALLACIAASGCGAGDRPRPDVILITLDTTRADHIGAYGYTRNITPSIDRFAADATLFTRAHSTASWTLPAHASIVTGKYPTSHGAHFDVDRPDANLGEALEGEMFRQMTVNRLGSDQLTMAELLGEAGYRTAAFVGGPFLEPVFGVLQGYDLKDAEIRTIGGRPADELTDRAVSWLREVPREQPVHMLVNYFDPHGPYEPPPGYDDLPLARVPLEPAAPGRAGGPAPAIPLGPLIDRYDGEIRFMDSQFGRLLAALRLLGRYDGALVIVVADHGESFGEHGMMEHGRWLYSEVIHVPLIIRYPGGRRAGESDSSLISVVDLLPLVSAETGLTLPEGVDGMPVGALRVILAESYRDNLFIKLFGPRFDRDLRAAIRWPWKIIQSDRGEVELYRLDEDPGELRNLADGRLEREMLSLLDDARAGLKPPARRAAPEGVQPKTLEQLRSLGYVE
ncbi:MAG: sulfatase [Deltaproteobacteria bacterium]|nr:sulfatase [Deltaproteobacteria bacterium]